MNETFVDSEIPNLEIIVEEKSITFISKNKLECLSNAAINGGRIQTKYIVNQHVPLDFQHTTLENVIIPIKKKYNLSDSTIGLLTAVKMKNAVIVNDKAGDINYTLAITAGLSNIISPFTKGIKKNYKPGTINVIVLFNCEFTEYAMVNLFITITEAKTLLLNRYNIRTPDGDFATGTSTDTITIGCTGKGTLIKWVGYSTLFGQSVGKTVYKGLETALKKGRWI
ncbi:MAG: adenosylcobinamide amidohydrolase [Promethearchaeota archaeon]